MPQQLLRAPDAAARAEDLLLLVRDVQGDPELAREIPCALLHDAAEMVRVDDDLLDAGVLEQREVVAEQGQAAERDERFGDLVGEGAQPRPESGAEDHRPHDRCPRGTDRDTIGVGWGTRAPLVHADFRARYSNAGAASSAGRRIQRNSDPMRPCRSETSPT